LARNSYRFRPLAVVSGRNRSHTLRGFRVAARTRHAPLARQAPVCSTTSVKRWIYLIRPVRLAMTDDPTEHEAAILRDHFARLEQLCDQGTVLLAGPSLAGADTFGLVLLDLEHEEDARAVMESDPAIVGGVMTGELRPFRMSLSRLRSR
jgi:uncharacterized protein YciI